MLYRSLLRAANCGLAIVSLTGRLIFVNKTLCEMIGYSKKELSGRRFSEFVYPGEPLCHRSCFAGKITDVELVGSGLSEELMLVDIEVEKLKAADKTELIELFIQAFGGHPLIPTLGAEPALAKQGMDAFLSCFGGTDSSVAYGIRKDDNLISAALCLDADAGPSRPALMQLVLFISRTVGWDVVKGFEVIAREEPRYKERYLEVMIFGTLPLYQKQGFGRKVLQFLYDEAKKLDYKGLTLLADRNTPAFHLYLKEGFVVDREFTVSGADLCWMRLAFR